MNPLVKYEGKHLVFEYFNNDGEMVVANAIVISDSFYLHSMEEPALNAPGEIDFFMYGHPVMIEDLHCDDEVRLCLKLKYTLLGEEYKDFYTYTT